MKSPNADASEQSTVHEIIASGAESCLVRRQKRCQLSDFFRCADPPEGMSCAEASERFVLRQIRREVCRGACQHGCADGTGTDRIDADVVASMIEGQGTCQTMNCPF